MIYSYLDSRLGNLMFEIAAGASLAKCVGTPFKAVADNKWGTLDYIKPFRKTIFRKVDFQENFPENVETYSQPTFTYSPLPLQNNLILNGGFQSEKYFDRDLARSLFEIDEETEAYIKNKYSSILFRKPVGIHVRRGDYLFYEHKHPVYRMSYFNKAISRFAPGTSFLVIGDDIGWCKKHFKGEQFSFSENESPLVDLYLLTMCSHNIISNSTFAWWGAWLNPNPEKKVVYPLPWFGPSFRVSTDDLCPEDWIAISVSEKATWYYIRYSHVRRAIRKIRRICGL